MSRFEQDPFDHHSTLGLAARIGEMPLLPRVAIVGGLSAIVLSGCATRAPEASAPAATVTVTAPAPAVEKPAPAAREAAPAVREAAPRPVAKAKAKAPAVDKDPTYGVRILKVGRVYADTKATKDLERDLGPNHLNCPGVLVDGVLSPNEWDAIGLIQKSSTGSAGDIGPISAKAIRSAVRRDDRSVCKPVNNSSMLDSSSAKLREGPSGAAPGVSSGSSGGSAKLQEGPAGVAPGAN